MLGILEQDCVDCVQFLQQSIGDNQVMSKIGQPIWMWGGFMVDQSHNLCHKRCVNIICNRSCKIKSTVFLFWMLECIKSNCFFDYSVCFIGVIDCSIRVSWSFMRWSMLMVDELLHKASMSENMGNRLCHIFPWKHTSLELDFLLPDCVWDDRGWDLRFCLADK